MTNKYHYQDNRFKMIDIPENNIVDHLPPAIYKVSVADTPFGLDIKFIQSESFRIPSNTIRDAYLLDRIKRNYLNGNKQMACLFYGLSGMGKSLASKQLCNELVEEAKMPAIIIGKDEASYFSSIIDQLNTPSIIFVDEFEKLFKYDEENDISASDDALSQNGLLSILDGTNDSKHLFIFTANNDSKISPYFFNRPSRIRYAVEYRKLPKEIVESLIDQEVRREEDKESLRGLVKFVANLTYDVLFELINEYNNNPGTKVEDIIRIFNIQLLDVSDDYFTVQSKLHLPEKYKHLEERYQDVIKLTLSRYVSMADTLRRIRNTDGVNSESFIEVYCNDGLYLTIDITAEDDDDFSGYRTDVSYILARASDNFISKSIYELDHFYVDLHKCNYITNSTVARCVASNVYNKPRNELTKQEIDEVKKELDILYRHGFHRITFTRNQ